MKKKALRKDFYMEIRKNIGRFISIFLIVALGVAFYSGIQATAPDMRLTGDEYFSERHLMDLKVQGTMGMTDGDVKAFEDMEEISKAEPAYSVDVLAGKGDENDVIHMESILPSMNKLDVLEGKMPEEIGECLLDARYAEAYHYQIGDQLEVREDLKEDEDPRLKTHTYTVSGIGSSPMYVSFDRGSSNLNSGTVAAFAYVTEDNFDMEVYTQIYLEAQGSSEQQAFSDAYSELLDHVTEAVERQEKTRCTIRYEEVKADADQELADARTKLDKKTKKANRKLAKAKKKIQDAKKKLKDGKQELADAKKEIEDNQALLDTKQKELNDAKAKLKDGKSTLAEAKKKLTEKEKKFKKKKKASKKKFASGEKQLEAAKKKIIQNEEMLQTKKEELDAAKLQYNQQQEAVRKAAEKQIAQGEAQLAAGEKELEKAKQQVSEQETKLNHGKQALENGANQIAAAWKEINSKETELKNAETQIASGESELASGRQKLADARKEVADGESELAEHEQELADGQQEYRDKKAEADQKIADANQKIEDAQKDIDDLKVPKWYLNSREEDADYTGYGENADRMRNIGKVFPVLFFLVAALISLTTMTRMVEEQRTQIGTLKALGYSKFSIASKYLGYAAIATLGGSIFGVLVGEKILPYIIIKAYGIMYPYVPNLVIPYNRKYAWIATAVAVLCTLAATVSSCYRELAAVPAALMRPPVPKQGKRVMLERITFLWKHLNFTWKSTIRNLFRYKKRFFMTIFGIGGCMALILVGYGLKDSIMDVAILQFDNLQFYDGMLILDDEASEKEKEELTQFVAQEAQVADYDDWYMKNITTKSTSGTRDVYLIVPEDKEKSPEFVRLRDRVTKKHYTLPEDGMILTEKAAKLLDVKAGDSLKLEISEGKWVEGKIAEITENYMYHYLYMTKDYYRKLAGEDVKYNSLVFDTDTSNQEEIEKIGQQALKMDAALGISYTGTIKDRLNDMLKSMDLVMVVLIVSAGMLAFVVLYNLNNININERKRELATLKVLGFYDGEVAAYVYRENILLTIIGAGLGCILGKLLHSFIIVTVEIDICMFGRMIKPGSFLMAVLFTIGFSVVVNGIMYFKLKKIDMVESLKSVE